ncbi:DUF6048 family protein [Gillisia sp. Hel_I_29]|uniref:DUF6048 family protein n=1 Tax=Gillisia sp. Hel_I_29 TaxID=1249975 RepID=UPI000556DE74|nr:DUF6048 family protein [Gillisia sp. Hel_I_29]
MKQLHIFLFTISIFFLSGLASVRSQTVTDSLKFKEKYGLRVGTDLSKLIRSFAEEDYSGFELMGDYRVYKNYYLAAEIGNETLNYESSTLAVTAKGSYIKLGADYNAYENWTGMENMIIVGARYGFATFSQTLDEYVIYTDSQYFPPNVNTEAIEAKGLNASWLELMVGIKVEVLNNLYLGGNVQLKRRIAQTTPRDFDNLTIPGFNRTYDDSFFGVGYNYSISYLIPLYKKAKN